MEKYSLLDTLKAEAESNDWVFLSGDDFYQNYESVMHEYEAGQYVLGCDFIASDQYNEAGSTLVGINYIGSVRFGRKKDSDDIQANLDETYIQKHERRLKELKIALSDFLSNFACSNQLTITNSVGLLEINKFDANIDFVGLQITFNQEDFTIVQETFTVNLSSSTGGTATSSLGSEDDSPFTVNKNTNGAFYADADPGFEFSNWLVNGVSNLLNPLAIVINKNYNIVANFIVSIIKQLSIAVVGNGTTDPAPGNYDVTGGSTQAITAIENDDNYIFDEFTVDGTPTTDNPVIVTVNDNTNVVAYFVIKWLQWVFSETITKIVDKYYFPDKSPNANNVEINNTQVGNFNGSVWITYDMTGRTIASYEGAAVPTKTSDSRIDVTAGLGHSLTLDNGATAYYNEENEDVIFFTDGTSGTLENVVLANFWDTKSEFGTPGTVINGYSKYLINQVAGTTAHLALPDNSNVGVEKVVNGGFDTDSDWVKGLAWTISSGKANNDGTGVLSNINQAVSIPDGGYGLVEFEIPDYVSGNLVTSLSTNAADYSNDFTKVGRYRALLKSLGGKVYFFGSPTFVGSIDNISVKEVQAIDLTIFEHLIKPIVSKIIFSDTTDLTGNGYTIDILTTGITLNRLDSGVETQLGAQLLTINDHDKITYDFSSGIDVKVNDVTQLTSGDTTYTTCKFITYQDNAGGEISHFTKDVKYDMDNFITQSGGFGVQKVLGIGATDAKLNPLEIPANVVSDSGNTYDGIEGLSDGATYEDVYDTTFDEETKTANKVMGYVSEIKVL